MSIGFVPFCLGKNKQTRIVHLCDVGNCFERPSSNQVVSVAARHHSTIFTDEHTTNTSIVLATTRNCQSSANQKADRVFATRLECMCIWMQIFGAQPWISRGRIDAQRCPEPQVVRRTNRAEAPNLNGYFLELKNPRMKVYCVSSEIVGDSCGRKGCSIGD